MRRSWIAAATALLAAAPATALLAAAPATALLAAAPATALLAAAPATAQMPGQGLATTTAQAAPVAEGGRGILAITVRVKPGYHINANRPNDPNLIPTAFQGNAPHGVTFGAARFPTPKTVSVSYEKKPMPVFVGSSVILVPFTVARTVRPGHVTLAGTLSYQACSAASCFPPTSTPIQAVVTVR